MLLKDALIKVGFACAGGEVRRKCMQGAVKVNNVRVEDPLLDLIPGQHKLTLGRWSCLIHVDGVTGYAVGPDFQRRQ